MRNINEILRSEQSLEILYKKRKAEVRVLINTVKDLNKTIKKLKKQEVFLNELLDKRAFKEDSTNTLNKGCKVERETSLSPSVNDTHDNPISLTDTCEDCMILHSPSNCPKEDSTN